LGVGGWVVGWLGWWGGWVVGVMGWLGEWVGAVCFLCQHPVPTCAASDYLFGMVHV